MATTTKPISKEYLIQSLKDFESVILRKDFIEKYEELPTAASTLEDRIVQYVGADDAVNQLTNGFFYQCVEDTTPGTYKWVEKAIMTIPDGVEYSIVKEPNADTGYIATYQLYGSVGGSTPAPITGSAKINIPKDFLVKSGEVKTVTAADKATGGIFENDPNFQVGDKYIDFVINVKEGTATDEHMYINVKDLVDVYTPGVGIAIDANNEISVKVGTNKGLEFTGVNSDELSIKAGTSDQMRLYLSAAGLMGSILLADASDPAEAIDFDTEW